MPKMIATQDSTESIIYGDEGLYTIEEYTALTQNNDGIRYEMINGEIYAMASPAENHQDIVGFIFTELSVYLKGKNCKPYVAPFDVFLFALTPNPESDAQNIKESGETDKTDKTDKNNKTNETDETNEIDKNKVKKLRHTFQPDIFVICDRSKIFKNGIYGAPDFVCEIVSPSSELKDYVYKLYAYIEQGVKEYWIVNPATKKIHVYVNGVNNGGLDVSEHSFESRVKASIFDGFYVDFKEYQPTV